MFKHIQYSFLFAFILFSCNNKSSHEHEEVTDENLVLANEILQNSLDIREELLEVEKQLKEASIDYTEVKEKLKIWDKDISEVPGFEHSHDDEVQRNYHVHNPMKKFSPEEHKLFQQVMHDEIIEISSNMKSLLSPEVMVEEAI